MRLLKDGIRDPVMETCCGLHNFRLIDRQWNWESDAVREAHHPAGPPWRDPRAGGGRYPGTPLGTEEHRERRLSGRRTLVEDTRHPRFRPDMGVDEALGAGTLEPAGVGVALAHHTGQAGQARGPATPQDQCGLGAADDTAGAPLAASGWCWSSMGGLPRWRWPSPV
jgi:hypothetical protein